MVFWEEIEKTVIAKTGLKMQDYIVSRDQQSDVIIEFLSFNCYPDTESDSAVADIKKEILTVYTKDIAPTISKNEVYSHTLDPKVVEAIYNLLQYITASELAVDTEREIFYSNTLSYAYFLKFASQKALVELYQDRIRSYKKIIRNFNHQGVLIEQKSFLRVINRRLWKARIEYFKSRKKFNSRVRKSDERVAKINLQTMDKDIGFDGLLCEYEKIETLFIDHFPKILANGYNMTLGFRLFCGVLDLISLSFLIYWLLDFFNLWQYFVSFFTNLL